MDIFINIKYLYKYYRLGNNVLEGIEKILWQSYCKKIAAALLFRQSRI